MVTKIMALSVKYSLRSSSHIRTPFNHNFHIPSINGSKNTSLSLPVSLGPDIRVVCNRYLRLWHNHNGMLYSDSISGHVLCGFLICPKGFITSVLKANLIFFAFLKNSIFQVKFFSLGCISRMPKLIVPLARMPCHHCSILRDCE